MSGLIIKLIVISAIITIVLFLAIVYVYQTTRAIKNEKRITLFALSSVSDHELSFFEQLSKISNNFISYFGKKLVKIPSLKKSSLKYEMYINYNDKNKKASDYVAIKFIVALVLVLLNIVSTFYLINIYVVLGWFVTFFIGFYIPNIILEINFTNKKKQIKDELLDVVIYMNNSFEAGLNIEETIKKITEEFNYAIKDEFLKIDKDLTYGLNLNEAFKRFEKRVDLPEIGYICSTLDVLNQNGGNTLLAFKTIEKYLLKQKNIDKKLNTMNSFLRKIYIITLLVPIITIIILYLYKNDYFKNLISSNIGLVVIVTIILIYIIYILIMKKMLRGEEK